jgi:uncharacterized protein
MTTGALPKTVEVRTLAARQVTVSGALSADRLSRLSAVIVSASAPFDVIADCFRDEEGRYIVELKVAGSVEMACQRCLTPVAVEVDAHSSLAAVWTDEQAAKLPARYEPLITDGELDLWQLVEEELLLVLPSFNYHSDEQCGAKVGFAIAAAEEIEASVGESERRGNSNPFDVLATLKGDG